MPPPLPTIPSTRNAFGNRTAMHVLKRGIWENKGEAVGPRPPSVLVPDDQPELPADVANPRTRLARWLVEPAQSADRPRPRQPGLAASFRRRAGEDGQRLRDQGSAPSHPELLDWLAATLVEDGWRLKPMHRLIVLSSTYRQASRSGMSAAAEHIDPENRLLWRFPRAG